MNRKRLRTSLCVWEKDQTMQQPAKRGEPAALWSWASPICTNRLPNAYCHLSIPLQMPLWGQNAGRTPREKDETALTGEFTLRSTNSAQKPTQSVKTDVMYRIGFSHTDGKRADAAYLRCWWRTYSPAPVWFVGVRQGFLVNVLAGVKLHSADTLQKIVGRTSREKGNVDQRSGCMVQCALAARRIPSSFPLLLI